MNDHNERDDHYQFSELFAPLAIIVASGWASIFLSKYLVKLYRLLAGPMQGDAPMQFFLLVLMFYFLVYFLLIAYRVARGRSRKAAKTDRQACLKHLSISAVYSLLMLIGVLVKAKNAPNADSMIAFVIVWALWFCLCILPLIIFASSRCWIEDSGEVNS